MIKSTADGKIEDTGPLTKKRMETVDDETSDAAVDFIQRQAKTGKPFFCWWNGTRMRKHSACHYMQEKYCSCRADLEKRVENCVPII